MKVLMLPTPRQFDGEESGIKQVVLNYHRYAPDFGIEFIDCDVEDEDRYDLCVVHAGTSNRYPRRKPIIAMCHGLYWSADYNSAPWEWKTNANVIESLRIANSITVPSPWVAEVIKRDMRVTPYVVPHGIDWKEWQHNRECGGYVLWNKNRIGDVCSPDPMIALAKMKPTIRFVTTFATRNPPGNVHPQGVIPHLEMKRLIQEAGVYLSSTKETFGIGVLEAMAAGVPVLGFRHGGNVHLVEHGVTGYLATPGNYEDLAVGLDYCLKHRRQLSENSKIAVKSWGWGKAMEIVSGVFRATISEWNRGQVPYDIPKSAYAQGGRNEK